MKNYLIYPTKKMYISQSYTGTYSHETHSKGSPADYPIDESCGDSNRDYFCCPCDEIEIIKIYGVGGSGTNTIWLQSTSKVVFANGTEDYCTILVTHPDDDTLKKLKVGQKFKRKQEMFLEGKDGNATGNHFHISVASGKYVSAGWIKNNKNAWVQTGKTMKPEDAYYVDNSFTKVLNSKGLKFKELPKEPVLVPVARDESKLQVEVVVSNLNVRSEPNTSAKIVLYPCPRGFYDVINVNGQWYEIKEGYWVNLVGLKVYDVEQIKEDVNRSEEPIIEDAKTEENASNELYEASVLEDHIPEVGKVIIEPVETEGEKINSEIDNINEEFVKISQNSDLNCEKEEKIEKPVEKKETNFFTLLINFIKNLFKSIFR